MRLGLPNPNANGRGSQNAEDHRIYQLRAAQEKDGEVQYCRSGDEPDRPFPGGLTANETPQRQRNQDGESGAEADRECFERAATLSPSPHEVTIVAAAKN